MTMDPSYKMIHRGSTPDGCENDPNRIMEKYVLRKAFEEPSNPYLPEDVLWRQKEQFSDGVGYGWIDALKDNAEAHVTDEQMRSPKPEWGGDIPDTKEAYWY